MTRNNIAIYIICFSDSFGFLDICLEGGGGGHLEQPVSWYKFICVQSTTGKQHLVIFSISDVSNWTSVCQCYSVVNQQIKKALLVA